MAALGEFVEVNELGVRLLRPAPRSRIEFVREDAHGNRDGDAFRIEVPLAPILPVETSARKGCVRQPGDGDVVEDVIALNGRIAAMSDSCVVFHVKQLLWS